MSGPRRSRLALALAAVVALAPTPPAAAAGPEAPAASKEYEVKAAFVFHFAQFVRWPSGAFADAASPLCIGVLGDDPFGGALTAALEGATAHGRPFALRHARTADELASCHVVFVSRSEASRVADVLERLGRHATLTVSEIDGFARAGGAIGLYLEGAKVRFEINPDAAKARGVDVGSELLSLGRRVAEGGADGR